MSDHSTQAYFGTAENYQRFYAEEKLNDVEAFAGWLESVSDERSPCVGIDGLISSPELIRLALSKKAMPSVVHMAMTEIRKRYLAEFDEEINATAHRVLAQEEQRARHRADTPL